MYNLLPWILKKWEYYLITKLVAAMLAKNSPHTNKLTKGINEVMITTETKQ